MEGNTAGASPAQNSSASSAPQTPIVGPMSAAASAEPGIGQPAVGGAGEDDLILIWPERLIRELAEERKIHPWATPLTIINFILMSIHALLLGPMQLILLVFIQDVHAITDGYFPAVLRISLLTSGIVALSTLIAMVQAWREQPKKSYAIMALGTGTMLMGAVIWIAAYLTSFAPNSIALLYLLLIAGTIAFTLVLAKKPLETDKKNTFLNISLWVIALLALAEGSFTGIFLLNQTRTVQAEQLALEELGRAQAAAKIDGVSAELSDLVYTLCGGPYDAVYLKREAEDSGIFQCKESRELYSVQGPTEPVSAGAIHGAAFYFGKDTDAAISSSFPSDIGLRFLYRDLSALGGDTPSELAMLLPAVNEELFVNTYLNNILTYVNSRVADGASNPLQLTIFYTTALNNILTLKDYIVIAAADTLSTVTYLPRGNNYTSYLDGARGTYLYTPDNVQEALTELAASPLLYSAQTLDALTAHRRLSLLLEPREYAADELRELLYSHFFDSAPAKNSADTQSDAPSDTPADAPAAPAPEPAL